MSRTLLHVVDENPLQCLQDRLTCGAEIFFHKHCRRAQICAFCVEDMRQMFYLGTYSHFSSHQLHNDDARVYIYNNHICC